MRHFIAYHNTERMGRPLHEGEPLGVLTNKPVQPLLHNTVWFVVGDGTAPRRYSLGSVFVVNRVGETPEEGFKHYASGQGHVFQPPPVLNDLDWFPEFFRRMARFSLGVQEVREPRFIAALAGLAAQTGVVSISWVYEMHNTPSVADAGPLDEGGAHRIDPNAYPEAFEEGALRLRFQLHRRKERNRRAVHRKKELTLASRGALLCEVCDFDFVLTYGALGEGSAECHHTLPLAALEEGHKTRLSELAIVCANCLACSTGDRCRRFRSYERLCCSAESRTHLISRRIRHRRLPEVALQ